MTYKPMPPSAPQPRFDHNILISIPRTASNLLIHLLALPSQSSITSHPHDGYFFLPALSHRFRNSTLTRPYESLEEREKESMEEVLERSVVDWKTWLEGAGGKESTGRGTYVKEHVNWMIKPEIESFFLHTAIPAPMYPDPGDKIERPANPTVIPDELWRRVRVTFLIRHPALTFPSALRTAIDNEGLEAVLSHKSEVVMRWECTFHWHVLLYQFLTSQPYLSQVQGQAPTSDIRTASADRVYIVDASQLKNEMFVKTYAKLVGLDPSKVQTVWDATSQEEQGKLHRVERRMKDTLLSSTHILPSKLESADVNVMVERTKWRVEFGSVLAGRLETLVADAMEEYEWLYERRLRV